MDINKLIADIAEIKNYIFKVTTTCICLGPYESTQIWRINNVCKSSQ